MIKYQKNKENKSKYYAVALLYTNGEENPEELFWENISQPYKSILEECYDCAEIGKYQKLEQITNNIKYQRLSYIKLGILLYQTRYYKLYKKKYYSFTTYCRKELHYHKWRVNQVIESAQVAIKLIKADFDIIPQNETQARILTKLNEVELISKWQEVLDTYEPHDITAKRIKKVVFGEKQITKGTIKLPINLITKIENKSWEIGISSADLISKIIEGELLINSDGSIENHLVETEEITHNPSTEVLERWEKDLDKLVLSDRNKIDDFAEDLAEEVKNTVTDFQEVIKKRFIKSFLEPLFSLENI